MEATHHASPSPSFHHSVAQAVALRIKGALKRRILQTRQNSKPLTGAPRCAVLRIWKVKGEIPKGIEPSEINRAGALTPAPFKGDTRMQQPCTCPSSISHFEEVCESCKKDYDTWLIEQENSDRDEARTLSASAFGGRPATLAELIEVEERFWWALEKQGEAIKALLAERKAA